MSIILTSIFLDTLYAPEITEAAARSHGQSLREQNANFTPQYLSVIPSTSATTTARIPYHQSVMVTPIASHHDRFQSKLIYICYLIFDLDKIDYLRNLVRICKLEVKELASLIEIKFDI